MIKKKKILFVVYQTGVQTNGGINSIKEFIINTKNEKYLFTNINSNFTKYIQHFKIQTKIKQFYKKNNNRLLFIISLLQDILNFYRFLKGNSCDIVHFNDIQSLTIGFFPAKLLNKKIVFNIRGEKETKTKYSLKWKLSTFCNKVLVLSEEMKFNLIKRLKLKEYKIDYIYSIVNENKHISTVKVFENQNINILIPGRFSYTKNQLEFIKNIPVKESISNNIVYHFVGDFDPNNCVYDKICFDHVKKNEMDDLICFHGHVNDINNFYLNADLTLIISKREGLCRSMIESMSYGTPVISFDVTSAKEILEIPKNGLVVKQGDYKCFFSQIFYLINNRNIKDKFSKNSIRFSKENFNAVSIQEKIEVFYNSI